MILKVAEYLHFSSLEISVLLNLLSYLFHCIQRVKIRVKNIVALKFKKCTFPEKDRFPMRGENNRAAKFSS